MRRYLRLHHSMTVVFRLLVLSCLGGVLFVGVQCIESDTEEVQVLSRQVRVPFGGTALSDTLLTSYPARTGHLFKLFLDSLEQLDSDIAELELGILLEQAREEDSTGRLSAYLLQLRDRKHHNIDLDNSDSIGCKDRDGAYPQINW